MKYSDPIHFKNLHKVIFLNIQAAMTRKGYQEAIIKFGKDNDNLRQNWEAYHLLAFANNTLEIKNHENEKKKLDDLLDSYGLNGLDGVRKRPSDGGFTLKNSQFIFKSLAEFQDIPLLLCFLNFLIFCKNSDPPRPLEVFNGENGTVIDIENKKIFVTLDSVIDDIYNYIKNEEKKLKKEILEDELSRKGNKQPNPTQPRLTIPQARENNPNYFANAVLDVIGRDKQKACLQAFLKWGKEGKENVIWFQLAGVSGQGKSRLAYDLIKVAKEELGFRAGFLTENDIKFFKDQWMDWQPDKPYLLIFDYVIGREQEIKPILQALIFNRDKFQHKIRILLVERQPWNQGNVIETQDQNDKDASRQLVSISNKAPWFLELCEKDDPEGERLMSFRFDSGVQELEMLHEDDLMVIVKQLFSGKTLTLSDDALRKTLKRIDKKGRPLYAYLLAQQLSESQEGYKSWTKIDLLDYQLARDKRRWEKAFNGKAPTWGDSHPAMKLAVLATIVREVKFQDESIKEFFGNIDTSLRREAVAITSGNLINDDNRPNQIYALEPDLLGEWYVLYCFYQNLGFEELLNIAWYYSPDKTADFLQRISQDFIDLSEKYNDWNLTGKLLAYVPPPEICLRGKDFSLEKYYQSLAIVAVAIADELHRRDITIPDNIISAIEHFTFRAYY